MIPETVLIILFVAASLLSVVANRLHIPYTVALVLGGLLLGTLHFFVAPPLTHALLFNVFLPGLIFESAYHLSASAIWRDRLAIFGLAVPGVLLSMVVTAMVFLWSSQYLPGVASVTMPLGVALVFAAAVAATDPISVVAIFRDLHAPQRMTLLVESESLLNDGTGIVFFTLFLAMALGEKVTAVSLVIRFVEVAGGGALVGALFGWLISEVIKRVNDGMVEITLTILAAYGSFLAATQLGYSGVISTVVAGLLCGNYGAKKGMSPTVRVAVTTFWEYIGFALNSLVFLLVGFAIRLPDLLRIWPLVMAAYVAITIARGATIYGMGGILSRTRARIPWAWNFVLVWGGVRGALSMVLVLSLPPQFPFREMLINLVFGVVLMTILIQGLSMTPVAKALGVIGGSRIPAAFEIQRMRLNLAQLALQEIARLRQEGLRDVNALDAIARHYRAVGEDAGKILAGLEIGDDDRFRAEFSRLYRRLLTMEKQRLLDARQEGTIGHSTFDRLVADIDAGLLEIESNPELLIEHMMPSLKRETETGGDMA